MIETDTGQSPGTSLSEPLALEQRRKRQILPAVIAVVAEEGFEGATMRKIASRAGVSVGMLSYYYQNKRDLLQDALKDAHARASRDVDETMGDDIGPHRIEALFDNMLERSRSRTFPLSFWLAYWSEAARHEEMRESSLVGLQKVRDTFRKAIEIGMREGPLRPDLNPDLGANLLMTLWQGARAEVGLAYVDEATMSDMVREALRLMTKQQA